jgi:hypothetical protein
MESYHVFRFVYMPIRVVSVLQVFSMTKSLLLRYCPKSTRRPELAEL